MNFNVNRRTLVVGTSGSGKTTFIENMLNDVRNTPVLIIDIKNDIQSNQFVSIDEQFFINEKSRNSIIEQLFLKNGRVILKGHVLTNKELSQTIISDTIHTVLRYLSAYKEHGTPQKFIFVLDEADVFHHKTKKCLSTDMVYIMMSKGRSVGMIGWVATQRIQMLHNDSIANTERIVMFYANPNDRKLLDKYFSGAISREFDFDENNEKDHVPHNFYIKNLGSGWSTSNELKI